MDNIISFIGIIISVFLAWWVYVIYIILVILYYLFFADSGGSGPNAAPRPFDTPQVSANAPVPVLFGTMYVRNMNVVWYGDVKSTPWEQCYG